MGRHRDGDTLETGRHGSTHVVLIDLLAEVKALHAVLVHMDGVGCALGIELVAPQSEDTLPAFHVGIGREFHSRVARPRASRSRRGAAFVGHGVGLRPTWGHVSFKLAMSRKAGKKLTAPKRRVFLWLACGGLSTYGSEPSAGEVEDDAFFPRG